MKQAPIPQLSIEQVITGKNPDGHEYDFFVSDIVDCTLRYQPIRHEFYLISLCTAGSMRITINLREQKIEPNMLLVYSPHQIIEILEFSSDIKITNLFFKKEFLLGNMINPPSVDKLYVHQSDSCGKITLDEKNMGAVLTLFSLIAEKSAGNHPYKREMIKNFIDALLYEIEPSYKSTYWNLWKSFPERKRS